MSDENSKDFISQEEYDALSVEEQQEYELVEEVELDEDLIEILDELLENSDILDELENDPTISKEDLHEISMLKKLAYAYKAGGHSRKLKKHVDNALAPGRSWNDLAKGAVANKLLQRRERGKGLLRRSFERVNEASSGAETLRANSKPAADPKSKIEVITAAIGAMHSMKKDDLVKWYNDTMAQFGKFGDGAPAASEKNKSSINAKPSAAGSKGADVKMPMVKITAKEDVEEMFGEELSEEFKERATTLFEAAVNARVTTELARLEEEFEERLDEELSEVVGTLTEQLDKYLDYVVENWMTDNEVAIESALRNELMEDFIDGLKGLFAEHYINVPETKLDVLESLASKVEELETRLNESIEENVEMKRHLLEAERKAVMDEVAEGLTVVQGDKFEALAEGIEFDGNLDTYRRKLNIIKENYFADKTPSKGVMDYETEADGVLTEEVLTSPEMKRYAAAISRTIKK